MSQARPIARRKPAQGAAVARAAGPRLGLALLVIATAQLMVVLDATIVNVALPHIQRALGFSAASLAGGFATSQAWLLAARAVQGAGAAIVAPTALALITTTFREGKPRNQAMG